MDAPFAQEYLPEEPEAVGLGSNDYGGVKLLGYLDSDYWYLTTRHTLISFNSTEHNEANLMDLTSGDVTPWQCFEKETEGEDGKTRKRIVWKDARNTLLMSQTAVGPFDPNRVRGRGAWVDGEMDGGSARVIYNTGETIIAGGVETELGEFQSKFIYAKKARVGMNWKAPAGRELRDKAIAACEMLPWAKPHQLKGHG